MKKILTAALVSALILGLAGCTGSKPDDIPTTDIAPVIEFESEDIAEHTPIYDNAAVVSAYKSGDDSMLSEFDKAIYDAAAAGISEFYRDGMSEDEIVLAAHDYITTLCTYDVEELALIPARSENSENPYGALINKRAICMGYTTSFQMFMDMLGVECIIVRGEATGEEHAWNMVHIGDNWYHVDCTWDDYVPDYDGRPAVHMFYMLTDSAACIDHSWDKEAAPKADSEDLNYYRQNSLFAETDEEIANILSAAKEKGLSEAEFAVPLEFPLEGLSDYGCWILSFDTYKAIVVHITLEN